MTDLPALMTLPNVDLVAAGTWDLSTGEATFTADDLASAVAASQCPAVGCPIIKLGHIDPRFDGEPAVGKVANMALTAEGSKITADLTGMPGWLGVIMSSAYPNRSIEGSYDYVCQIGHTHDFVITALALLGVSAPGVGVLNTLEDVAALYGMADAVQAAQGLPSPAWRLNLNGGSMPGITMAAGVTTDDVMRAYYGDKETPYSYWVTCMTVAPPELIVNDEATSKMYRVPITIKGSDVTFGDPIEVEIEYVDVAAARRKAKARPAQRVTWASAAASRAAARLPAETAAAAARLAANYGRVAARITASGVAPEQYAAGAEPAARSAFLRQVAILAAADTDADERVSAMVAALDATLDEASALSADADRAALPEAVAQALDLITAAEAQADQLMALLGVYDPDDPADTEAAADDVGDQHGAMTITHSHAHGAYGSQGDDQQHSHSHVHSGDGRHDHSHASAKAGNGKTGKTGRKEGSGVDFTDDQLKGIRTALGLADDAELGPEQIAAGLATLAADAPAVAARRMPPGVVAVDQGEWDALNNRVKAGEAARTKAAIGERDSVIAAAVKDGKFTPARKPHWQRLWDKDPEGTREVIAGLVKNVVPVDDIGGVGGDADQAWDEEYSALFGPAR